jgi:hypothetical protein
LQYKKLVVAFLLFFAVVQTPLAESKLKPPKRGKALVVFSVEATGSCLPSNWISLEYVSLENNWYSNTGIGYLLGGPKYFKFELKDRGSDPRIADGWFVVKEIGAEPYSLFAVHADGARAVINRRFDLQGGTIYYLGAMGMVMDECGWIAMGSSDKRERDLAIFREKHPELASAAIEYLQILGPRATLEGKPTSAEGSP